MKKSHFIKPVILLVGLTVVFALWRLTPLGEYVSLENARSLAQLADRIGWSAPLLYISFYAVGTVVLLPGSVMSTVGGLSFGVYLGTILVVLGSTIGSALAFLTARYLARPLVERLIADRPMFRRLDRGVEQQGWRMMVVIRLVPIFPFMFVNYALGLTRIRFWTYVGITFFGMIPSSFAICLAAGSLVSGGDDWKRIFLYLLLAGILFALMAMLPVILKRWFSKELVENLEAPKGD